MHNDIVLGAGIPDTPRPTSGVPPLKPTFQTCKLIFKPVKKEKEGDIQIKKRERGREISEFHLRPLSGLHFHLSPSSLVSYCSFSLFCFRILKK